ncbi:hypothetical protein [Streptomyces sp. NPDC057854]|uniref:hypothetical protein n=1 Tax=unclassified Streptomyces TaxID=2593676 RepID=UPI0036BA2BFA
MAALRQYFEDNPEIFAALVAAIAILGGLLGSIIGAKIQANGGRDQAAAAREAATIAAEAQRVAALWSVRQVQMAEFIRGVREVQRVAALYSSQDADSVDGQMQEAHHLVAQKLAEIELIMPFDVAQAAKGVHRHLEPFAATIQIAGRAEYFFSILRRQAFSDDPAESELARRALEALDELREEAAGSVNSADDKMRRYRDAIEALRAATNAPVLEAVMVATHVDSSPSSEPFRRRLQAELAENMSALVAAARAALRSEDDAAPAPVPVQRRWWRRAA